MSPKEKNVMGSKRNRNGLSGLLVAKNRLKNLAKRRSKGTAGNGLNLKGKQNTWVMNL